MIHELPFDIQTLRATYAAGATPKDIVGEVYRRIEALGDPGIFLLLRKETDVIKEALALSIKPSPETPLWGLPFVIKDNI